MTEAPEKKKYQSIVSIRLGDGSLLEAVYSQAREMTEIAVFDGSDSRRVDAIQLDKSNVLRPVSPKNNLIRHGAVLFAEKAEHYESVASLISEIERYLYKYVDLSDHFRKLSAYYALLTWVYDAFNELPYLRLRGDFGSGKTRALFVIGSICNKPFFASGASSVSPIFHTLDTFRGTLIIDEADFRFSDEKNELVKIFNNGNVKGFPVLRTAVSQNGEFNPQAFNVFGPKVVAMRKSFDDPALESRFLTEEMGQRSLRSDIPINLPNEQKQEALGLRNKLLMYRFRTVASIRVDASLVDASLSPRLNQILIPLLSIIEDEKLRGDIREAMRGIDHKLYAERSTSIEACILKVLHEMQSKDAASVSLSDLAAAFNGQFAGEFDRSVPVREIGSVLRKRLRLAACKSHGVYVVPASEKPKVKELCIRYGVLEREASTENSVG